MASIAVRTEIASDWPTSASAQRQSSGPVSLVSVGTFTDTVDYGNSEVCHSQCILLTKSLQLTVDSLSEELHMHNQRQSICVVNQRQAVLQVLLDFYYTHRDTVKEADECDDLRSGENVLLEDSMDDSNEDPVLKDEASSQHKQKSEIANVNLESRVGLEEVQVTMVDLGHDYCMNDGKLDSRRHQVLSGDQEGRLEETNLKRATKNITKWGVSVYKGWLFDRRMDPDFEKLPTDKLAQDLKTFYAEACSKDGKPYSKSAFMGIRSGLNRYLSHPLFGKGINIITDKEFCHANKVFSERIKSTSETDVALKRPKPAIILADVKRLYLVGILCNTNPISLQNKVFFELCLFFRLKFFNGLQDLSKGSFRFLHDFTRQNQEYVMLDFGEKTELTKKKSQFRMYTKPFDLARCQVNSLKLYLSRLNPSCPAFFQQPKRHLMEMADPEREEVWYKDKPLGMNNLKKKMTVMSQQGRLSQCYTNECIAATDSAIVSELQLDQTIIVLTQPQGSQHKILPSTGLAKPVDKSKVKPKYINIRPKPVSTVVDQTESASVETESDNKSIDQTDKKNVNTSGVCKRRSEPVKSSVDQTGTDRDDKKPVHPIFDREIHPKIVSITSLVKSEKVNKAGNGRGRKSTKTGRVSKKRTIKSKDNAMPVTATKKKGNKSTKRQGLTDQVKYYRIIENPGIESVNQAGDQHATDKPDT